MLQGQGVPRETGRIRGVGEIYAVGEETPESSYASNRASVTVNSEGSFDPHFRLGLSLWSSFLGNHLRNGCILKPYLHNSQEYPTIFHAMYEDNNAAGCFGMLLEEAVEKANADELKAALEINGLKNRLLQDRDCDAATLRLYGRPAAAGGAGAGAPLFSPIAIPPRPFSPPPAAASASSDRVAEIMAEFDRGQAIVSPLQAPAPAQQAPLYQVIGVDLMRQHRVHAVVHAPAAVAPAPAANNAAPRRFVIGSFPDQARVFERAQAEAQARDAEAIRHARWRSRG
ncbi:MAG: hypothetical protein K0R66_155 [Gammaproteobacteria bacterium]|jgi:hypothetical protein|nr:hypothetical protein [Gammaproteobacteria bacterium]